MEIAASFLVLLLGILFVATFVYIIVWVYRDANRSGIMPGWLAVLIVIIIPHCIGLILYLVLRLFLPSKPVCRVCGSPFEPDSRFCPSCAASIISTPSSTPCSGCGRSVSTTARFCPYCSSTNTNFSPAPSGKSNKGCLIAIVAAIGIFAAVVLLALLFSVVRQTTYSSERAFTSNYSTYDRPSRVFEQASSVKLPY